MSAFQFQELLSAEMPKGDAKTDEVLHRWYPGLYQPPNEIVQEARMCSKHGLPFHAHDKQWRVTYYGMDEADCFVIEGVEWV